METVRIDFSKPETFSDLPRDRATFAQIDSHLAELVEEAMEGKVREGEASQESTFGPQDAARFARKHRSLVRAWMDRA